MQEKDIERRVIKCRDFNARTETKGWIWNGKGEREKEEAKTAL